jgi:adenylate kinase family enzyme
VAELNSDIVLIGPVRSGKSTVGRLLAERLGLPQVSLDSQRWQYYKEIGYDEDLAREIRARGGFPVLS